MRSTFLWICVIGLSWGSVGCRASERTKDPSQFVGGKLAQTATYEIIVRGAVRKLVDKHKTLLRFSPSDGPFLIAFVGLENTGAKEMRDQREAIHDPIEIPVRELASMVAKAYTLPPNSCVSRRDQSTS